MVQSDTLVGLEGRPKGRPLCNDNWLTDIPGDGNS